MVTLVGPLVAPDPASWAAVTMHQGPILTQEVLGERRRERKNQGAIVMDIDLNEVIS